MASYGLPVATPASPIIVQSMPAATATMAPPSTPPNAYEVARSQRVSTQPYPATQTAGLAVKQAISTKGAFPSKNTTTKVQVKCGFEVRYCGKWLAKQAPMRQGAWVILANKNYHQNLLNALCQCYKNKIELNIKNHNGCLFFGEQHFSFCRLGTREGYVSDQEGFVHHLQRHKFIDLLLDYNEFNDHSLNVEEEDSIKLLEKTYSQKATAKACSTRSGTVVTKDSQTSRTTTPSVMSTHPTIAQRPNSLSDFGTKLPTCVLQRQAPTPHNKRNPIVIGSPDLASTNIDSKPPTVVIRSNPPWFANAILDPEDLEYWNRFSTRLAKIPWAPLDLKVTNSNSTGPEKFNPNLASPQFPEDQRELLDVVKREQSKLEHYQLSKRFFQQAVTVPASQEALPMS
ncbi:hypothetical protein PCASD_13499 [Puccinia coronata f. sp. avenae]|uniref:Uncharacterized protein n=1 Tax=Puccinia coronata f. sp. avenae TaxID=200324 RepID=A0A2N5TEG9_9BASI|nr:hypothetical protein PCASD_13499 [Puccinia coronata f. sp. avenae]